MAKELAKRYGADVKKAELAALCHDLYRKLDAGGLAQAVRELGIDEKYAGNINLAHGKVAAAAMKRDFGINDEDVLNAVSFHTTGRAGMSLLEKIIYVADGAEENRDYPGVERVRKAAFEDIDKACLMMMENTIEYVKGQGQNLDEETLSAAEYFRKILNTEEHMNSREQAMLAAKVLDSKKAQNIVIIDIAEKSSFADYLVIAGGGSERQTLALTDDVEDAMAKEGYPFVGCLYAGLMITAEGPKVVEFNCRFGDPETEVVLPMLDSDLAEIMLHCVNGTLSPDDVKWKDGYAVDVVLASEGYPQGHSDGDEITGLAEAETVGCHIFHAGTKKKGGVFVTAGGRVLNVVARAATLQEARDKAYEGVAYIQWRGMQYRHDIAAKGLKHLASRK